MINKNNKCSLNKIESTRKRINLDDVTIEVHRMS